MHSESIMKRYSLFIAFIKGGHKNSFFHLKLIEKMSFYLNFRALKGSVPKTFTVLGTALIIFATTEIAFPAAVFEKDNSDSAGLTYRLRYSDNTGEAAKVVFLIGADNTKLSRIVYIFHGYKPEGDTYKQSPLFFIKNWNLETLAKKYSVLFVLTDNGDSVYPVTKANDPLSDMALLAKLKKVVDDRFHAENPAISIGFSAGVEGAIKFALSNNIKEIMAISGNYDLHNLPAGEKAFHEKAFGKGGDVFEKENPITLLRNSGSVIYLFCEEKNATNVKQAQALVDAKIPGISIVDMRPLGKGFRHDWTFLTSPGIKTNLEKIVSGNGKTVGR
jgi:hypothetical protein